MAEPKDFVVSALKFRPQKFSDVTGQEHIGGTLRNAVRRERLAHAYLFEGPEGITVLPLAEIDFGAYPASMPRIVDYAAKWSPGSFEYANTPRLIPAPLPAELAAEIEAAARRAWQVLGCRDYARVDFRLAAAGSFHILKVNSNPDISPDAGYAAALACAGFGFDRFVLTMVENARHRALVPGR